MPQEEVEGRIHARAGLRAGASIQPAAIPQRSRKSRPGPGAQADRDPSEDLVPEPALQDEAETTADAGVVHARPERQEGGRQGPGQGRRAAVPPAEGAGLPEGLLRGAQGRLLHLRPDQGGGAQVPQEPPRVHAESLPAVLKLHAALPLL